MEAQELDALVYPTMRRPIARIGDRQAGSTCQLSASTGLPALSVPAGFTEDRQPFAIELLGLPFSDPDLLALGFSFEQNTDHRRPPFFAPLGDQGLLQISIDTHFSTTEIAHTDFIFDPAKGSLKYLVSIPTGTLGDIYAMTLQLAEEKGSGGVIYRLSGPGNHMVNGEIVLDPRMIARLKADEIVLTIFSSKYPKGEMRSPLTIP